MIIVPKGVEHRPSADEETWILLFEPVNKEEDELFYVVKGRLKMEFRNKTKEILQGEMIVVPKGVEHRPSAEDETWILLFEPINTKHTGDTISKITKDVYPKI